MNNPDYRKVFIIWLVFTVLLIAFFAWNARVVIVANMNCQANVVCLE